MSPATQAAYGQLLGIGLLWISVHCAGMCGPLLIGLDVPGVARGQGPLRGALSVLTYQAGRGLTYAWLGGLMGLLGAGLGRRFTTAGAVLAGGLGLILLLGALRRLVLALRPVPRPPELARLGRRPAPRALSPARWLAPLLQQPPGPMRELLLGAAMGLLPCMIAAWAMGLAAITGSPLHGAAIMLLLCVMTTPMLLGVTLLPRVGLRVLRRAGARLPPILLGVSGLHMLLISGAALGWLPHAHLGLRVLDRPFLVMLF